MNMPPEFVEQLLNAGPKCSTFQFHVAFRQNRCSEPVCMYHCRMAHDEGGGGCNVFWKVCICEAEIDGDRGNNSIESFTRL